jgi:hypothetical protein
MGLFLGVYPGKGGQKRGMDIEYPVLKGPDKSRGKYAHEPGQNHGLRPAPFYNPRKVRVILLPGGIFSVGKYASRHAVVFGPLKTIDVRFVADHELYARIQASGLDSVDNGLQIGAAPGYQNGNGQGHLK